MPILQQLEAYITGTYEMFDEDRNINSANDGTVKFLRAFVGLISKYK